MAKLGIDRSQSIGHIQEQVFFPLFVQCKRVNLTETILNFLYYLSTSVHPIIVLVTRNITMRTIQTLFLDLLGHGRLGQSL